MRNRNQCKFEIIKLQIKNLKTVILCVSELKLAGLGHFHSGNYKVFYSECDKFTGKSVALLREVRHNTNNWGEI